MHTRRCKLLGVMLKVHVFCVRQANSVTAGTACVLIYGVYCEREKKYILGCLLLTRCVRNVRQDGQLVTFAEVIGMTELNDGKPRRIRNCKARTQFVQNGLTLQPPAASGPPAGFSVHAMHLLMRRPGRLGRAAAP